MTGPADPAAPDHARQLRLPEALARRVQSGADSLSRRMIASVSPFRLEISAAPHGVQLSGDEIAVTLAAKMLERIVEHVEPSEQYDEIVLGAAIDWVVQYALKRDLAFRLDGVPRPLRPMSLSQVAFLNMLIRTPAPIAFGVGPTGTGKTHLAVAAALNALARGKVRTIILTRPHVMMEGEVMTAERRAETEYDPQLAPLEDILHALLGREEYVRLVEQEEVQVMPLGRMRGRTFNDCFLLIDEAQNMTVRKMRMAVTRIGRGSRIAITGDPEQIDLRGEEPSGLAHLLAKVEGGDLAAVHRFSRDEIIRNEAVARLEALYAEDGGADVQIAA